MKMSICTYMNTRKVICKGISQSNPYIRVWTYAFWLEKGVWLTNKTRYERHQIRENPFLVWILSRRLIHRVHGTIVRYMYILYRSFRYLPFKCFECGRAPSLRTPWFQRRHDTRPSLQRFRVHYGRRQVLHVIPRLKHKTTRTSKSINIMKTVCSKQKQNHL